MQTVKERIKKIHKFFNRKGKKKANCAKTNCNFKIRKICRLTSTDLEHLCILLHFRDLL